MSTDTSREVAAIGEAASDLPFDGMPIGCLGAADEERARDRQAAIQRILAQRKPDLIQEGVEAYKRDLPRLLAENRYRQLVAYRGDKLIAFAANHRQLKRRLTKAGYTDEGELFVTSVAPLEIDE